MENYTPDELTQALNRLREAVEDVIRIVLHNTQSTAAATTVAGWEAAHKKIEALAVSDEGMQAQIAAILELLKTLRQDAP